MVTTKQDKGITPPQTYQMKSKAITYSSLSLKSPTVYAHADKPCQTRSSNVPLEKLHPLGRKTKCVWSHAAHFNCLAILGKRLIQIKIGVTAVRPTQIKIGMNWPWHMLGNACIFPACMTVLTSLWSVPLSLQKSQSKLWVAGSFPSLLHLQSGYNSNLFQKRKRRKQRM